MPWLAGQFKFGRFRLILTGSKAVETLFSFDRALMAAVNQGLSDPFLDDAMILMSARWPWFGIAFILLWWAWAKGRQNILFAVLWVGLTIGFADMSAHFVLKPWFGRVRPCRVESWVRIVDGCYGYFSFPSNHATNAAVFASLWFCFFGKSQGLVAAICCFLIGFSRIYLGVHYPIDILGGFLFGIILGLLSHKLLLKCRFLDRFHSFRKTTN